MTTTTTKLMTRDSWTKFADTLAGLTPFKTSGALRGDVQKGRPWMRGWGQLPQKYWDSAERAEYVVFSYDTPIAWRVRSTPGSQAAKDGFEGTWYVPNVHYSMTTSRHQSKIRTAVTSIESWTRDQVVEN